jgi:hypothetical protein
MWDFCHGTESALSRVGELRDSEWKGMLNGGATPLRLDNSSQSAIEVLKTVVNSMTGETILLLQRQIVDEKRPYAKTDDARIANGKGIYLIEPSPRPAVFRWLRRGTGVHF